jgi:hypothetical protein
MKIVRIETLISAGAFSTSTDWKRTRARLHAAIRQVDWPPGSGLFTIHPEPGKKRGEGNGVKPIKDGLMKALKKQGWKLEEAVDIATAATPGDLDAVLYTKHGAVALEWETGNISSSHRALNKMALGILKHKLVGATLVVPSRKLYRFLTDRIGNITELEPYFDLWKSIACDNGVLEIVVIEHDAESKRVRRIPKGTSGRALQ